MYRQLALALNWLLTLLFAYHYRHCLPLASPILHTFTYFVRPHCHAAHCHPRRQYEQCEECGLPQWIRMHHCYRCGVCVHKYDHHCILLGLCIGEANQKYYISMMWMHMYSSCCQAWVYLHHAGDHLWID